MIIRVGRSRNDLIGREIILGVRVRAVSGRVVSCRGGVSSSWPFFHATRYTVHTYTSRRNVLGLNVCRNMGGVG